MIASTVGSRRKGRRGDPNAECGLAACCAESLRLSDPVIFFAEAPPRPIRGGKAQPCRGPAALARGRTGGPCRYAFPHRHRSRGPGFPMMASWSSQFWSWDAAGTKMAAIDTGYGLGFNFTLGGIYPVYSGNLLVRFELLDAAGVICSASAGNGDSVLPLR